MAGTGTCYSDTFEFLLKGSPQFPHSGLSGMDSVQVVHGSVISKTGQRVSHAWVEMKSGPFSWVWESQLDRVFSNSDYYQATQAVLDYKLSPTELIRISFRCKNYGPFTAAEREPRSPL